MGEHLLSREVSASKLPSSEIYTTPSEALTKWSEHRYHYLLTAVVAISLVVAAFKMAFLSSVAVVPLLLSGLFGFTHGLPQGTSAQADGLTQAASSMAVTAVTTEVSGVMTTYTAIPTLSASIDETPPLIPNIEDPMAVNAQDICPGYTASGVSQYPLGFTASLALAGKPCNAYGTDVDFLNLTVQYQSGDRLAIRIEPTYMDATNSSFYLIPKDTVNQPSLDDDAEMTALGLDLQFIWGNEPSFWFGVLRKSTGDMLFNTEGSTLVFEDQFLEFVTAMPSNYNIYGLGEHIHAFRLGNNFTSTIWNADVGDIPDANLYGTHPFYMDTRYYERDPQSGELSYVANAENNATAEYESYSHGVYLRNAHGHEILMKDTNVTWRTLGGSIDMYFFVGPTAPEVTAQYQKGAIGLPAMQQYWTFGYHQCRWGYANWTQTKEVVDNLRKFGIPMETVWHDIDYMTQYRDFDNDPIRFGYEEGSRFLDELHANGQHYVPIVDSAIYIPNPNNASDAYAPYNRGHAQSAFMLNPDGSEYIGAVWPGFTVFPDWHSEGAHTWWTSEILNWWHKIAFDGIWIDMSEASSFCVGSCGSGRLNQNQVHPPFALPGEATQVIYTYPEGFENTNASEAMTASSLSASQASALSMSATPTPSTTSYLRTTPTPGVRNVDYPPYVINNYNGALGVHGLAPNATHRDGVLDYDVHNLWGYQILNATYNALRQVFPTKRPFIIGRSSYAGSGVWAGHWGGDNYAEWRFMYWAIPQALSFAMYGIPMFGPDTCGFAGQSDEELCNRWMQVSAFFPFYRNHNTLSANSQEPYVWSSVIVATKAAMNIRYRLLPYMYTLFFDASTTGSTVMRALAWEFPKEPVLASADRQFMLGPSLMVVPVLTEGASTVDGVFPGVGYGTVWYDWYNQTAVTAQPGVNTTIDAPLGHIPVFVRGGSILPMQEARYTTAECRQTPWSLLAALSKEGTATGSIYLDDGESLQTDDVKLIDLTATNGHIFASGVGSYQDQNPLANITILGVPEAPSNITLNGMNVDGYVYNNNSKTVSITGLESMTSGGAWSADWELTWS